MYDSDERESLTFPKVKVLKHRDLELAVPTKSKAIIVECRALAELE